jgi:hypothetical protein
MARPRAFDGLCDDEGVPLICPTCQVLAQSVPAGERLLLCMGLFSIFFVASGGIVVARLVPLVRLRPSQHQAIAEAGGMRVPGGDYNAYVESHVRRLEASRRAVSPRSMTGSASASCRGGRSSQRRSAGRSSAWRLLQNESGDGPDDESAAHDRFCIVGSPGFP